MATTLQLERIAALVDKLDALAGKQRGMRIEAHEWNALVDVLRGILEVDRTQEDSTQVGLKKNFAAIDHEHLGEVGITWLDADLQARFGGAAGSGSVLTRTALAEAAQKITSLGTEVARLSALAATQQTAFDRAIVDASDRSRTLQQFETRFAGIDNLRTLVTTVSSEVDGLRSNVDTVLKLRESLSDAAGNPIDVAKLQTQVGDLGTLRENLKGVDGNLVRLREIEIKLNEVSDAAGVGGDGGLDQRINTAVAPLRDELKASQDQHDAELKHSITDAVASRETKLRAEVNSSLDTRTQSISASVTEQIAASETRTGTLIDTRVAASATAVTKAANDNAAALIDQKLAGVPDQVRTITTEQINALRSDLATQIRSSVTAALDTRFNALQQNLDGRMNTLETRVEDFGTKLPSLVDGSVNAVRDELSSQLSEQIKSSVEALRGDLNARVAEQIKSGMAAAQTDLDARVESAVDIRLENLDAIVAKSVANATLDLPSQISAEVKVQIDSRKLSDQITVANNALATQLRAEQAQALASQQAKTTAAINNSVTLLRGEINATRTDLTNTINTRTVTTGRTPVVSPVR